MGTGWELVCFEEGKNTPPMQKASYYPSRVRRGASSAYPDWQRQEAASQRDGAAGPRPLSPSLRRPGSAPNARHGTPGVRAAGARAEPPSPVCHLPSHPRQEGSGVEATPRRPGNSGSSPPAPAAAVSRATSVAPANPISVDGTTSLPQSRNATSGLPGQRAPDQSGGRREFGPRRRRGPPPPHPGVVGNVVF